MRTKKYVDDTTSLLLDLFVFSIMVTTIIYAMLSFMELQPSATEIFFPVVIVTVFSYFIFSRLMNFLIFLGLLILYIGGMATNLFDFLSSSRSFFYRLFDAIVHGTIYEFALLRESFIIFVIIGFTLLYYLFVIKLRIFLA